MACGVRGHRAEGCGWAAAAALVAVAGLAGQAVGQNPPPPTPPEQLLQNDRLLAGQQGAVQAGFVVGEVGASMFQMPATPTGQWRLKRVQILWYSLTQSTGATVQGPINVYQANGTGGRPGVRVFESDPSQMVDGFLNEFDLADPQYAYPPVLFNAGERFAAGLEFDTAPNILLGPSLVSDTRGCIPTRSYVLANGGILGGGWQDLCAYGARGNLVIRAVVEPYTPPPPPCRLDYNSDTVVNTDDLSDYVTDYFTEPAISGPGGYASPTGCPGAPSPYDQFGYRVDFNDDCLVNVDDISDFITAYFRGC